RGAVVVGNGLAQLRDQRRTGELGDDLGRAPVEGVPEGGGEEERGLGEAEGNLAEHRLDALDVPAVEIRGPGSIEGGARSGIHRGAVLTSPRARRAHRAASFARWASRGACRGPRDPAGAGYPCSRGHWPAVSSTPAAPTRPGRSRCRSRCGGAT